MKANACCRRVVAAAAGVGAVFVAGVLGMSGSIPEGKAAGPGRGWRPGALCDGPTGREGCGDEAGTWYWLRSPEQERRVVARLYNRYCARCHGLDGRGVWDMPDVPNFANDRWQAHRSDAQLARAIVEGRGAVMPAFRGTLTLEQSWALARYLRTFIPGTEMPRPDDQKMEKPADELPAPRPAKSP